MANTHYAHVLAGTGGAGTHEDPQRYVSLDGLTSEEGTTVEDITGTESNIYTLAPGQVVVKVQGSVTTLDAIKNSANNVELFRDELPQEVV